MWTENSEKEKIPGSRLLQFGLSFETRPPPLSALIWGWSLSSKFSEEEKQGNIKSLTFHLTESIFESRWYCGGGFFLKLIPNFGTLIKLIARIARLDCNVILPLCQSLTWQPAGLALDKGTMLGEKQSVRSLLKKWKLELKLHAYSFQDICDLWDRVMMPWPTARQLHIQRFLENTFKERFCTIVTFETFD